MHRYNDALPSDGGFMRARLMQDTLDHEGVEWVALIGPDALPIDLVNLPLNFLTQKIPKVKRPKG